VIGWSDEIRLISKPSCNNAIWLILLRAFIMTFMTHHNRPIRFSRDAYLIAIRFLRVFIISLLLLVAGQAVAVAALPSPFAFCVYNKTKQQTMSISTAAFVNVANATSAASPSPRSLAAGSHFCCKVGELMCPGVTTTATSALATIQLKIEPVIQGRKSWCGNTAQPSAGINVAAHDGYLLIRDSREIVAGSTPPTIPNPAIKPSSPSSSAIGASATSATRAALNVDVLAADGRLLTTWPCQFSG
jgi:hypothetical protein